MTEIALREYDTAPAVVGQQQAHMQNQAVDRLGAWASAASAAFSVAEKLVETSFVPEAFRGKPMDATAAILAGSEVGLSPMSSLKAFDVIQGTAAARAITLRAVVQSQGHEIILKESTNSRCVMAGRRRDSKTWQTSTWTIDRAKGLGLLNKPNWKQQPATMLVARATSEICRLVAADAILGIGYTLEEISDGADVSTAPSATAEPGQPIGGTRKMSRATSRKPKAEDSGPPQDLPAQESADEPLPEPEPITDKQLTKLHATFTDLGITEREHRLAYAVDVIGREVESSKDLTKDEAGKVIDALEAEGDGASQETPPGPDEDDPWAKDEGQP